MLDGHPRLPDRSRPPCGSTHARGTWGDWAPAAKSVASAAGLNTGLFVCADDVIIGTQWSALPDTLVKIEDGSGFSGKVRIAGEDPASMSGKTETFVRQGRRSMVGPFEVVRSTAMANFWLFITGFLPLRCKRPEYKSFPGRRALGSLQCGSTRAVRSTQLRFLAVLFTDSSRPPRLCGESPSRTPERLSLTLAVRLCPRVAAIRAVCVQIVDQRDPTTHPARTSLGKWTPR